MCYSKIPLVDLPPNCHILALYYIRHSYVKMDTYQPVEVCYAGPPPLHWLLFGNGRCRGHSAFRRCRGPSSNQKHGVYHIAGKLRSQGSQLRKKIKRGYCTVMWNSKWEHKSAPENTMEAAVVTGVSRIIRLVLGTTKRQTPESGLRINFR